MVYPPGYKPKNWTTALVLLLFLGIYGGHRFYTGKAGTAILMLILGIISFSGYVLGDVFYALCSGYIVALILWIIDLVRICTGKFTDKQGYPLKKN